MLELWSVVVVDDVATTSRYAIPRYLLCPIFGSFWINRGCGVLSSRLCVLAFLQFEWTRPWSLLCKLIWIEWSDYQGDYDTKFFYLTNLPQSWFQIFLIYCNVKEILYSLSWSPFAKRKIPMAWLTFMVHSEGDTATSLPLLLCSGVVVHEVHDFTTACTAACLDDMKACNCYCCNLKQKFHSKCSTFSIITR